MTAALHVIVTLPDGQRVEHTAVAAVGVERRPPDGRQHRDGPGGRLFLHAEDCTILRDYAADEWDTVEVEPVLVHVVPEGAR